MACNCIDEMNAKLEPLNTELALTFGFSRSTGDCTTTPTVETKKINSRMRVGPAIAIATFCPFCGSAYRAEPAIARAEDSHV